MENQANVQADEMVHFTLADVLASYVEETPEVLELREKLSDVEVAYDYDMVNDDDNFFEKESERLAETYGLSEKAAVCLSIDLCFFAVKKTGDNLMGEMNKLCRGMEMFKNAVESGLDVDKVVEEIKQECGLKDL
ncbi:MAG: hypothetical protein MJZ22_03160 [Candidatus Saccharibacteria bacterium]|nr:hypothetical protein [Candidatus Saccharibacteria bacterium]